MAHESLGARLRGMHPATIALLLGTAVALLLVNLRVAGTVHEMNLDPTRAAPPGLDPITRYMFFRGWPLSPFAICNFHGMKFHPEESPVQLALVLDLTVAGLLLFGVAGLTEWLLRRRPWKPAQPGMIVPQATSSASFMISRTDQWGVQPAGCPDIRVMNRAPQVMRVGRGLGRREFQTSWALWAALSAALFVLGGFVNLMPDIKGTNHFWGNLGILLDGDYICATEEVVLAVAFHATLVAVPAVVFGWVLQALALVILRACARRPAAGDGTPLSSPPGHVRP